MTSAQLLSKLFALPTSGLNSQRLSYLVYSILTNAGESPQLCSGTLAGQSHSWVEWQALLIDFRHSGMEIPEDGVRNANHCGQDYQLDERRQPKAIDDSMLMHFCQDHAHFDHLA
ncbi:hypothetical protein [Ferrimonas aestuarii]|uniref:Uncharacterized protein n=1 Tax=Ferrimonas aestuarii TaxID=2569539 RepID=A0A4U1BSD5_9GAMM|nr:hypothetical protein [Ferrimonas aestuarii]TKB58270.1 hypothetical protein FCL42_00480 [Ferrimonas aestuarii]